MRKLLLFFVLLGVQTACQRESDIQPGQQTLVTDVVGTYHTNVFLDPSCVAMPSGQMPSIELKRETDSMVTLVYTRRFPDETVQQLNHVRLVNQADGIQLQLADANIGQLQTDRIFTESGMEKQGKLLRIALQIDSQSPLSFAGFRQ